MIVGWEWMWRRTKRLADLLDHPHILDGAFQITEHFDRYAAEHKIAEGDIRMGDAIFVKGLRYIEYPLER